MRGLLANSALFFTLFLAITAVAPSAAACVNATISDSEAVKELREADRALDEGDVVTARDIARDVRRLTLESDGPGARRLHDHATRLLALTFVRDRDATPDDLQQAVSMLEQTARGESPVSGRWWAVSPSEDAKPEALRPADSVLPTVEADLGEAYERAGRDDDALRVLTPIADKDVVGSAWALAALGRAARRHGDLARASSAETRCLAVAISPAVCRGEYPKPPLLRGGPLGYFAAGLVWAGALLLRIRARRSRRRAPWLDHAPKAFALVALAGGVLSLAVARHGVIAGLLAAAVVYLLTAGQRLAFVRAVRRGKIEGFWLRPSEPGDGALPLHRLAFDGTPNGETLEHLPASDYRTAARVPLARLRRQRIPGWLIGLAFGLFLLASCLAALSVTMRGIP